jgi:hypothetical protein
MMRRVFSLAFLAFGLALSIAQDDLPKPVPQPVAFSHRLHADSGLQCARCHTNATSKDEAGIPNAKDCIACHQNFQKDSATLKTLTAYEQKPIAWVRVYKLPSFVFFSHKSHLNAKTTCANCHGEVQTREVLGKEKPTSMASCIECHRERKASTECNYCHELNR